MVLEQAVHGAHATQIAALIKQRGMHTGRGSVGEALATQSVQYQLTLSLAQGQGTDAPCVRLVVVSFMQPTAVYRAGPNAVRALSRVPG